MISMGREDFIEQYRRMGCSVTGDETTPQAIRINPLKTEYDNLVETLIDQGVQLEKIPFLDHGYKVLFSPFSLGASIEYRIGYFSLQETASQLPVQVLSPTCEDIVLDMAAAPGGKTTQMAVYMENKSSITSVDVNRRRLYALENNVERTGTRNTLVYHIDALDLPNKPLFTKVLLDAPCSGNYVTDKVWFEKRTKNHIMSNSMMQRRLIGKALRLLETGGTLLYSTCSLEPEENELNIQWMLENHNVELQKVDSPGSPGVTRMYHDELDSSISKCRRLWPNNVGSQGFFMAKVVKL